MLHAPNDDARGDAEALRKGLHVGVGFQPRQFAGAVGRDQEVGGELVGLLFPRIVARPRGLEGAVGKSRLDYFGGGFTGKRPGALGP
jgi:hypothetical protein